MPKYRAPGVYVEEMSLRPKAVTEVATAIPAFIGYTERTIHEGQTLVCRPTRIESQREFDKIFGRRACRAFDRYISVVLDASNEVDTATIEPRYYLYDSVRLFYANDGGPCYIVSAGAYRKGGGAEAAELQQAIESLEEEDESTILVVPDAVLTGSDSLTAAVQETALTQCGKLRDRVAILDIRNGFRQLNDGAPVDNFRDSGTTENLMFGSAYYPWLESTLAPAFDFGNIRLLKPDAGGAALTQADPATIAPAETKLIEKLSGALRQHKKLARRCENLRKLIHELLDEQNADNKDLQQQLDRLTSAEEKVTGTVDHAIRLEAHLEQRVGVFARIYETIRSSGLLLPPGGAIAGVFVRTDNAHGVWKPPANVDLSAVSGPSVAIDDRQQDGLNTDAETGKSINTIRSVPGKGTLVWGARTLAGNDNEWRYISVRRFFNMVEESIDRSTLWAVFETNDATTWSKVETMINAYLAQKWRQGALLGTKAEDAFFVHVGLGKTMSQTDILEGRMIIEIGMAVVQPAEFVILRIMRKMPEA